MTASPGQRKAKSLGELCKKFVQLYANESDCVVSLDWTTARLCVERRRIYDIINILECLEVVSRLGKNTYRWNGLQRIPATLKKLANMDQVPPYRRDKSLGLLCLNFLHLFLHNQPVLSLKQAAVCIADNCDEHQVKTKIRRLYDISNILVYLRLAEKSWSGSKAVYVWRGVEGFQDFAGWKGGDLQVWAPNYSVSTPCFDQLMSNLVSCIKNSHRTPLSSLPLPNE